MPNASLRSSVSDTPDFPLILQLSKTFTANNHAFPRDEPVLQTKEELGDRIEAVLQDPLDWVYCMDMESFLRSPSAPELSGIPLQRGRLFEWRFWFSHLKLRRHCKGSMKEEPSWSAQTRHPRENGPEVKAAGERPSHTLVGCFISGDREDYGPWGEVNG